MNDIAQVEAADFDGLPAWRIVSTSGATALIAERGATLISWQPAPGKEVIAGYKTADELVNHVSYRSAVLAPWCGRIAEGSYSFGGERYELGTGEDAMHGFATDVDFYVESKGNTLTLRHDFEAREGYPWGFTLTATFSLDSGADDEHLSVSFTAKNTGEVPIPLSLGWHPYVQLPGVSSISNLSLTIPARTKILTDCKQIPLPGEAAYAGINTPYVTDYLGSKQMDTTFRGLVPDDEGVVTSVVSSPATGSSVSITQEPSDAPAIHVFTADGLARDSRSAIALEPYSHLADAYNRADSKASIALAPGEQRYMTATLTFS